MISHRQYIEIRLKERDKAEKRLISLILSSTGDMSTSLTEEIAGLIVRKWRDSPYKWLPETIEDFKCTCKYKEPTAEQLADASERLRKERMLRDDRG